MTPRSKQLLIDLRAEKGADLSPHDLTGIVLSDPLLCLRLLRAAECLRSHHLAHETTTALGAIMKLGVDEFCRMLTESEEVDDTVAGLMEVEARAALASRIAMYWASGRQDLSPEEVAVASLLVDTGELLLWVYAPELPQAAKDELASGEAQRSVQAQRQACGFDFRSLTIRCAEQWNLPGLICQLLRGSETVRAKLSRSSTNAARHLIEQSVSSEAAIAADLVEVQKLLPGASVEWLIDGLIFVPPERIPIIEELMHGSALAS